MADDDFAVINTPEWLTAFRVKCNEIESAFESVGVTVKEFDFTVSGIKCEVHPKNDGYSVARIGKKGQDWLMEITAPSGWFQPNPAG